jgi:DNA-binding NarL/FixJ family response regulator
MRVLITDEHATSREFLKSFLSTILEFQVAGKSSNGARGKSNLDEIPILKVLTVRAQGRPGRETSGFAYDVDRCGPGRRCWNRA